ncbi:PfkB family carbohydrate kinase [Parafrankia elaeagni]|uniref:PfkB family carbohydrate kinase n=1 Tax=Parafrankia elaeagni TaxID=222534 RepID=UPI00037651C2|nr:PfkB family carbohydrate kinase [Parafrankia elaeagni]
MKGVFVGLTTLDSIYLVDQLPGADEKCVARDFVMNAGGPATNAAVTFAYLGGRACLVSAVGTSPAAALVHDDLARAGVRHIELVPEPGAAGAGADPAAGGYGALAAPGAAGGAGSHVGRPGRLYKPTAARTSGVRSGRGLPGPGVPGGVPLGPVGHGAALGPADTGGPNGAGHPGTGHNGTGRLGPGPPGTGRLGTGHNGTGSHPGHGGAGAHGAAAGLPAGSGPAGPKPAAAHPAGSSPMSYALPMSAVMVTSVSGERAVTSTHGMVPRCTANTAAAAAVANADVVLVDGHQVDAAVGLLRTLRGGGPPVLLDGGSWKPGTEQILPFVDVVICSAAFRPPGFDPAADILDLLLRYGPFFVAVTDGPGPIRWATTDRRGYVLPPVVTARDTLGAGDVFHGAFAWLMAHGALATDELVGSLGEASRVAARSVQTFGPRSWMT